jgi:hypothetical protein
MGDIDVLIKPQQVSEAATLLKKCGIGPTRPLSASLMRYMHGAHFAGNGAVTIDMHWRLLWESCDGDSDREFWEGVAGVGMHDVPTSVLNPTDQLFHTCVHGARWSSAPVRWVADALTIVTTCRHDIDYERLVAMAAARRLSVAMQMTLGYLDAGWALQIPKRVLETLQTSATAKLERAERHYLARDRSQSWLGGLPIQVLHFWRVTQRGGLNRRLLELPRFLAFTWHLRSAWEVPFWVVAKTVRRTVAVVKSLFTDDSRPVRRLRG